MILDPIRFIVGSAFLFYAAMLDVRTRRVPNRLWVIMGGTGLLLLFAHLLLKGAWYHYLIFLPLLTLYAFPFIELEKMPDFRKGIITPLMWYAMVAAGFAGAVLLLYYGGTGFLTLSLIACAVFILIIYLMYFSGLLFGGADAKGMMAITLFVPLYPEISAFPLFSPEIQALKLLFPFPVVILAISVLVFAFLPLALAFYNLIHGDIGVAMFFGYRMNLEDVPRKHVWLMERPVGEEDSRGIRLEIFPHKTASERLESEVKILREMGKKRVWITPKIPFMVSLFAGYVISFILGNVLFALMGALMG